MARVVPSLIRSVIEKAYPWGADEAAGRARHDVDLGPDQAPSISMILGLLDALPPELHPTSSSDLVLMEAARGQMRGAMSSWAGAPHYGVAARLRSSAVFGGDNAVVAALKVLGRMPAEAPPGDTSDLHFISDAAFRELLRLDLGTAHRAYGNGEYKAATVLAGSVIEALLLWGIDTDPDGARTGAIAAVNAARKAASLRTLAASCDAWHLVDYIEVAARMGLIDTDTRVAAELTRDFRNFIHPGKVQRTGQACSQSTTLVALGAAQRVVEEFERRTW